MGDIVNQYADIMIITDDDPDTENRLSIIQQVQSKITNRTLGKDLFIIPERTLAIQCATNIAQPGDILIFAGK
ncbi:TPA: hypothetical protein DEP21_03945 [Patescibacteria group bacterium]|nr:hypothetical protein [Candidatus Gracilibacteria bacterium]